MNFKKNYSKVFYGFIANNTLISSASIVANISIIYFLYSYTGSAIYISILAIITSIFTIVISLPLGTFIDKFNRGLLLSASGFTGGIIFILFAFYTEIIGFNLYLLIIIAVFRIFTMDLFRNTNSSILPDITSLFSRSNALNHSFMYSIRSISSIIAGIIISLSIVFGFLYSSLTFFIAGIISLIIVYPFIKNKKIINSKKHNVFNNIKDGFKYIVKEKGLFQLTLLSAFLNISFGITFTYLVVYIISGIHGNALIYGIVLGVYPSGYVAGSFLSGYTNFLKFAGKIWILHGILSGISFIIMGLYPSYITVIIFYIIIGISVGFSNNIWLTSSQNIVPDKMRGRYFATDSFFTSIFGPLSIVSGILLILAYGIIKTFIISGFIMLLFSLIFLFMKNTFNFNGNKIYNQ